MGEADLLKIMEKLIKIESNINFLMKLLRYE